MAARGPGRRSPPRSKTCDEEPGGCQIAELFHILGKTHMLDLLHVFIRDAPGPHRFVELQERLSLSPNTLSDRLKELVRAGLVTRRSCNEIPPRVDYGPTPKALDLRPVFESLAAWAARNNLKPEAGGARAGGRAPVGAGPGHFAASRPRT
ncbi:MAG: helix-turn-helix domain-containing protein [Halobacteria archaeon]